MMDQRNLIFFLFIFQNRSGKGEQLSGKGEQLS